MINVLADKYLYNIQAYLPESINLQLFDPARGLPAKVDQAHAILVRTVIPINKKSLSTIPSQLEFIGTGSSGTDHVDQQYLSKHNIHFADAAGCNARSVAEYVAAALLLWAENRSKDLSNHSIGIIGVGHVGTEVHQLLDRLGWQTVLYDPPREKRDPDFCSVNQQEVLDCDILTFHTPLNRGGNHPTFHWLDEKKLSTNTYHLVINSARGGVISEKDLLNAMKTGTVRDVIIDTWEDEPEIHPDTAAVAFLKTPHIAGYSVQAKQNASKFIADELITHFNLAPPQQEDEHSVTTFDRDLSQFHSLSSLLSELHPIKKYETQLEKIITKSPENSGEQFNRLRAEFPLRQEFNNIQLPESYLVKYPVLTKLGFSQIS
ncbi:MAG: 4-phosphoerythronate dehydrogenase [Bacteroidota bacterium]